MKDFFQSIDFENQNTYLKIILFILIANIIGTNIFIPDYFSLELAWRIWTWSLLADIVFIEREKLIKTVWANAVQICSAEQPTRMTQQTTHAAPARHCPTPQTTYAAQRA